MIPVIDFSPFLAETPRGKSEVASAIGEAAQTIGFFYIGGHRVRQDVIDTAFEVGRRFFALPDEAKQQVKIREQHGYQALKDVTRPGYLPNINESSIHVDFMIGSSEVRVLGLSADGSETPVLVDGAWQL